MRLFNPTRRHRLNEAVAVVYFLLGCTLALSLLTYHQTDPSWNSVRGAVKVQNRIGPVGAHLADALLQSFGLTALLLPLACFLLGWRWLRSRPFESTAPKVGGAVLMGLSACAGLGLAGLPQLFSGAIAPGGVFGSMLADALRNSLNVTGAVLLTAAAFIVSLYLVSTFSMDLVARWLDGPISRWKLARARKAIERQEMAADRAREKTARKAEEAAARKAAAAAEKAAVREERSRRKSAAGPAEAPAPPPLEPSIATPVDFDGPPIVDPLADSWNALVASATANRAPVTEEEHNIPIRTVEDDTPPWSIGEEAEIRESAPYPEFTRDPVTLELEAAAAASATASAPASAAPPPPPRRKNRPAVFQLPPTDLLNEPPGRNPFDEQELKEIAARIKSKFEEFNVLGSVVQINPGPVVTTFEFKPEAGIKYSRITTLTEDLCLGLQAESILIERIPGKPTVGIEVPNSKREVISLRQIMESDEFVDSHSHLTISLGKDISGRIKVAALESMPHLLIAGSTGSGKSVMLNTLIMSVLYKSTPNDVRMIMVDPKRVELGIYEGVPHLLTPVITDAKKATNALRNAVLEMERRLKLLASLGVRNIDQFNKKVRQTLERPRSLFDDGLDGPEPSEMKPLPYILIIIDELADLMMLERANVEESVTRLAQMARAVGMHLVLATQRPSVDVITGLIKANFPARVSFRVATRVDSRTILDVMGAEHLLGKGDMLFLPPGSSRLIRVHGAFITETEIGKVVDFWKEQAAPEYDSTFLLAPPSDDVGDEDSEQFEGDEDPMYQDAVRVVLEMGKASTSILQRRLRLGYGRAARILDMMQRDGIIGPPDGSRPREVLKRPDWLEEVGAHQR
jgi:DNA segregation ATPase FtsK/SpoIIIE, S-DNA-T family